MQLLLAFEELLGTRSDPAMGIHCCEGKRRFGWVTTGTICPSGRMSAWGSSLGFEGTVCITIGPCGVFTVTV